jgi:hypothetical protein
VHFQALNIKNLIIITLLISTPFWSWAETQSCGPRLPWQTLHFEKQQLWMTARAEIVLASLCGEEALRRWSSHGLAGPPGQPLWQLSVESSAGNSSERLTALLRPADLAVLYKERLSKGKEQRQKSYRYGETGIQRTRRDPGPGEGERPASQWSRERRSLVDLTGEQLDARPITLNYAILLLASDPALRKPDGKRTIVVHTDHNLYRVELHNTGLESVESQALIDGLALSGARSVHRLALRVTDVGQPRDKPDFALLELGADISILVDNENGLPLLVRGKAPGIGETEIHLMAGRL